MQIGNSLPSFSPASTGMSARPLAADAAPTTARAAQAPATPADAAQSGSSASGGAEEGQASRRDAETSPQQQREEQLIIADLAQRDREVRAHEQAHAAVGGQYAGAPTYGFERGPDGQRYAVSGEVPISTSAVPNDPAATLRKMEIVRRAALAPAEPSAQDLRVAAEAQTQATQARAELALLRRDEAAATVEARKAAAEARSAEAEPGPAPQSPAPAAPDLDLYRRLNEGPAPAARIDLIA